MMVNRPSCEIMFIMFALLANNGGKMEKVGEKYVQSSPCFYQSLSNKVLLWDCFVLFLEKFEDSKKSFRN